MTVNSLPGLVTGFNHQRDAFFFQHLARLPTGTKAAVAAQGGRVVSTLSGTPSAISFGRLKVVTFTVSF